MASETIISTLVSINKICNFFKQRDQVIFRFKMWQGLNLKRNIQINRFDITNDKDTLRTRNVINGYF